MPGKQIFKVLEGVVEDAVPVVISVKSVEQAVDLGSGQGVWARVLG